MKDLSGRSFGTLTVVRFSHRDSNDKYYWECICECGKETITRADVLNHAKSCGCVNNGQILLTRKFARHNLCGSAEYSAWENMKARCNNPNNVGFDAYGGRGIKVCERWDLFENFLSDMGNKPTKKHSLDRFPNINGNYEPSNCRWATRQQQDRNLRRNNWVEYNGEKMILSDLAKKLGTSATTIRYYKRINKLNDFFEKIK